MRVVDRLAQREQSWRELESIIDRVNKEGLSRVSADDVVRLGELYRAACTDLMLAEAHDLPRDTIAYLHGLVGRAHNTVYRARGFKFSDWGRALFFAAPRQIRNDPALRIAAAAFFGSFLVCALLAAGREEFAPKVVGRQVIAQLEMMYSQPIGAERKDQLGRSDSMMFGFYIQHNASIGLRCFALGLLLGLGTIYELLSEGMILGTMFGHMARTPYAGNFFTFVTGHAVFELSAIVLSGAAGLRLGYGLIDTKGETRIASLRREAKNALPMVGAAVVLFVFAAFIEGYVSPSSLPYAAKAGVAAGSAVLLAAYLVFGGRERRAEVQVDA